MTNEQIKVATSAAIEQTKRNMVAEGRVYPVPLAYTKCRWCGDRFTTWTEPQWRQMGFCSRSCVDENLGGPESDD